MNPKSKLRLLLPLALAALTLSLGGYLFLNPATAAAAFANSGDITGTVTSPDGYPLPSGTVVRLHDPGDGTLVGSANPDLNDGSFLLPGVPNGLYTVKAVPPAGSSLAQSQPAVVSVLNAPVNVGTLALTEPEISGTVFAPDGVTPHPASVRVKAGDGTLVQVVPAPAGEYQVGGLFNGGYVLEAVPAGGAAYWNSPETAVTVSVGTTQTVDLTLTEAQIWGTVEDDQGNPIGGATIIAASHTGERAADHSTGAGAWSIGGLPDGTYWLTALPPLENVGLLSPHPIAVTVPGSGSPLTLVFDTPPKTVTGIVETNTGTPVENALVTARRVNLPGYAETLTAADGSYQLDLSSGLWALNVHSTDGTDPAHWVFPYPAQLVFFQFNNSAEARTQNFEVLTADATVQGHIILPDTSEPPFTVTVGLYNGEGIGSKVETVPGDGLFTLRVPNGSYDVVVFPHSESYVGPAIDPVSLAPNETLDLGSISLLPRDAMITGTISSPDGGVEGLPVVAWRPGVPGSLRTASSLGGLYAMSVSTGTWHIQPAPGPTDPYLYIGAGARVQIEAGQAIADVNFEVIPADATISGVLVDEAGNPIVDANGWAGAIQHGNPAIHNGAPIESGGFTILVPAGTYNVAAHLPAGSPYMSTGERQVSAAAGETALITLTVKTKDATIAGALWDPRNEDVVEGVPGIVAAWGNGHGTAGPINPGNGTYALDVAAGVWQFNYRIDQSDYAKAGGPKGIAVQSGQTAIVPLPVVEKDGEISGTVLDPDGQPLAGAIVVAHGTGRLLENVWTAGQSGDDGSFSLRVPHGVYRLGASVGADSAWINPIERLVEVLPDAVSSGHVLQFQEPNATISGSLTVSDTQDAGHVYVWAWSDDGGFTHSWFDVAQAGGTASGVYSLDVVSGTIWHVGAIFETSSEFWSGHGAIEVVQAAETLDLTLTGPHPKPGPVVVTFDAANPQTISLADGTEIFIPGGALPVVGTVTLRIVPIASLPHLLHGRVISYGYAFFATDSSGMPVESSFNQDVIITFGYDDADLHGIPESALKPAYFSTTTNEWTAPESYVINTSANEIIIAIDHFTNFALINEGVSLAYLPLIRH
jgi:hypothetical protein